MFYTFYGDVKKWVKRSVSIHIEVKWFYKLPAIYMLIY